MVYRAEVFCQYTFGRTHFPGNTGFVRSKRMAECVFFWKRAGLHPAGSEFRQAVWQILLQIPYGQTTTYGEIARQLADVKRTPGMSAQAVGGAVGHNAISIIIPCHRVVGSNGSLTGYAGGMDKKVALLKLEHTDMSHFFIPKKGTAVC